jgi:malonyl-CoA O-methyltransferase
MLLRAGFADPVMDQEALDLSWEGPEALRAELRSLGANASPARAQGLRTPRWREQLDAALRALRDGQGRIHLGFEVVYGHAFKVAPPRRGDGETTVSLGDMRALLRAGRRRGA